ncbi:alpha/beta hydrolase [Pedobacter aquatilis]|uniref:alpha/beta fold hydrolase n=1 Tax=Pedobacter aquatilis TaxID=351343 RepID=UPI00292D9036|nr:alpha/beta hydrolase [Pedobacter aquatilis]
MKKIIHITIKALKYIGSLLLILLVIGIVYEQYSRWRLESKAFKGETFTEIDGAKIHYVKKGIGNKTIVFVSGMGSNSSIWAEIQDKTYPNAVTISYDRSGLFLSEKREGTITNQSVSKELAQLLEQTNCPKPYILVLHSMAGIYIRPFIEQHKKDIAGIMLMESAHPLQLKKSSAAFLESLKPPPLSLVKFLTFSGAYRSLFSFNRINPEIPIEHAIHKNERDFFYRSVETLYDELKNDDANFEDAGNSNNFGNIPLTVITGTSNIRTEAIPNPKVKEEYMQLVHDLHRDFLNLSTDSKLVEAKNSGHVVQVSEPDLIVREIHALLKRNN